MRALLIVGPVAGLLLAGCAGPVPDSNLTSSSPDLSSAPLGSYAAYELERARREAALTGAAPGAAVVPAPAAAAAPAPFTPVIPATPVAPASGISTSDLAAAGIGGTTAAPVGGGLPGAVPPFGAPSAVPGTVPGDAFPSAVASAAPLPAAPLPGAIPASPGALPAAAPAAAPVGTGTLTAPGTPATSPERPEWNPQADPLRDYGLEAQPGNAAPVLVTAPVADPSAASGPNLVDYALAAPNTRGQEWYSRSIFTTQGRASRNCADYRTPDEAQRDFLLRGGPERDARGLDPDGDGFACGWDPAPFRAAVGR